MNDRPLAPRTRFAPSPTGYLHLGGARTALFAWLYARRHQGAFILRIEDTDRERSTQASIDAIFEAMAWLGLDCDEGPFYQTQRFDRYREVIEQLLIAGKAYRCYCTKERLAQLRDRQMVAKEKPRYDGCCREYEGDAAQPYVIRFRNPTSGAVTFEDQIRGVISVDNRELDDLIIARSDGTPTYNFTVVVDDWDMKITHVIRGDDHINNTPRQMNILSALGAPIPIYAHVPMILGPDGKRLSKRHGAVSVMHYKAAGFLPETMLNALVRLGWSHGDQEFFTRDEMIKYFDLAHVNRAPASFNEAKLLSLNQHYLKALPNETLLPALAAQFKALDIDTTEGPTLEAILDVQRDRAKTLREMSEASRYFFEAVGSYDEKAAAKHFTSESVPMLQDVCDRFSELQDWHREALHKVIVAVSEARELKLGKIAPPIRIAMTGTTVSPSIDITLELLGRERVLARLKAAIAFITNSQVSA